MLITVIVADVKGDKGDAGNNGAAGVGVKDAVVDEMATSSSL